MKINSDEVLVKAIRESIKMNDGYCPCKEKIEDNKCPCRAKREKSECICGLFVKSSL